MKKLELIKNWGYETDSKQEADGYFALALVDRKMGTATAKRTDRQDYIDQFNYGYLYSCREVFHKVFTEKDKSILFFHEGNKGLNISDLVLTIENKLGISSTEQTRFFATQRITVSPIRVSRFWLDGGPMHRQLFTLILRAGRNHVIGEPYENALKSSKYTKECFPAIKLFLDGWQKFSQHCLDGLAGNHHAGFVHYFTGKHEEQIKNFLLFQE